MKKNQFTKGYETMHLTPKSKKGQLSLGKKPILSNQEMDQLRQKLAEAASFDPTVSKKVHVPATNPFQKRGKSKEITGRSIRAGRKTEAKIKFEQGKIQYNEPIGASRRKYIPEKAKTILQDDYSVKPRKISTVPIGVMEQHGVDPEEVGPKIRSGKQPAPQEIQQVFIM